MISVVIPAYNAQAYLRECLESVLAQSFSDWEVVLVNDGSTDSTLDIALSYAALDSRIRVITTPNRGQSAARNEALATVSGEWITFLDSDDVLFPHSLERMMSVAEGVDVVSGQFTRDVKPTVAACVESHEIISGHAAVEKCLYQEEISTAVWSKMFRRAVVGDLRFPEGVYYEDILYCVEAFLKARRVAVIPDVIYGYRDNPSSFINTFNRKRFDVLRITADVERMCAPNPALLPAARDRRLSDNCNIYGLLAVHDSEDRYRDVRRQCWQLIKDYRLGSLRNPRVRLKNKLGVLVSLCGETTFALFSKIVYR